MWQCSNYKKFVDDIENEVGGSVVLVLTVVPEELVGATSWDPGDFLNW